LGTNQLFLGTIEILSETKALGDICLEDLHESYIKFS